MRKEEPRQIITFLKPKYRAEVLSVFRPKKLGKMLRSE